MRSPRHLTQRDNVEAGGLMSYGSNIRDALSSSRRLCWPHPQGRQASGLAGRAIEQVRARHQRPDRAHARPRRAADATCRAPTR